MNGGAERKRTRERKTCKYSVASAPRMVDRVRGKKGLHVKLKKKNKINENNKRKKKKKKNLTESRHLCIDKIRDFIQKTYKVRKRRVNERAAKRGL